jgi:hypothetical protein
MAEGLLEVQRGGGFRDDALEIGDFLGIHAVLHALEFFLGALDRFIARKLLSR